MAASKSARGKPAFEKVSEIEEALDLSEKAPVEVDHPEYDLGLLKVTFPDIGRMDFAEDTHTGRILVMITKKDKTEFTVELPSLPEKTESLVLQLKDQIGEVNVDEVAEVDAMFEGV